MVHVNLGNTGLRVSRICLGMMSFGKRREPARGRSTRRLPSRSSGARWRAGITFFDTADVYNGGESEVVTGRLLKRLFGMREEYVVATKVHGQTMPGANGRGLSRKHIMASIDASLRRLGLDYVDLYQIHRWDPPDADRGDDGGAARRRARRARRATSAPAACTPGSSPRRSTSPTRTAGRGSSRCRTTTTSIYREEEREMIPLCLDQGVGVIPWSPLARGLLAGNQDRGRRGADEARGHRPVRRYRSTARARLRPSIDRVGRGRAANGASRRRRSRSPGCCTSRASRRRSSARRRSSTSRTRSPPSS